MKQQSIICKNQLAVLITYQSLIELHIAVDSLPDIDALTIVKVDNKLFNFISPIICIGHYYEGGMYQTITIDHILFSFMHH